jgi:hypothetical protein
MITIEIINMTGWIAFCLFSIICLAIKMRRLMNKAKVIEHEPTVSTVAAFEIDDIRIIEETGEVIVTYMPEFSY